MLFYYTRHFFTSCLPGSGMCTSKGQIKYCDTFGSWITIDCPNKTSCSLLNGKLGCNKKKDTKKKGRNNLLEEIGNVKYSTEDSSDDKNDKKDKVKTKTVYKKRRTVTKTKAKDENKSKTASSQPKSKDKEDNRSSQTNTKQSETNNNTSSNTDNNDSLLKTLSEMIKKAKEVTTTQTVTEKTAPKEIKLEYTGPSQIPPSSGGSFSNGGGSSSGSNNSGGSSSPSASGGSGGGSSSSGSSGNSASSGSSPGNSGSSGASKAGSTSSGSTGSSNGGSSSGGSGSSSSGSSSPTAGNSSTGGGGSSGSTGSSGSSNGSGSSKEGSSKSSSDSKGSSDNSSSSGGSGDKKSSGSGGSSGGNIIDKETMMKVLKECNFSPSEEHVNAVLEGVNKNFKDKAMAAQFLAQIAHESGGYKYDEEIACAGNKCPGQYGSDQGAPGKQYYGRGFMQLSWPANYKAASNDLYKNNSLYENPEKVASDLKIAYDVSQWFWDTNVMGKPGVGPDHFGFTTKAINGALECKNNNNIEKSKKRYDIYTKFAKAMKLEKIADEEGCYTV